MRVGVRLRVARARPNGGRRRARGAGERAWELVSPSDKGGNDVIAETSRTHAAASAAPGLPMAVAFASLGGFADASRRRHRDRVPRAAHRAARHERLDDARDHAAAAAAVRLRRRAAARPRLRGASRPTSRQAIFRAWSPLTAAPNVAEVENLYAREDLRTARRRRLPPADGRARRRSPPIRVASSARSSRPRPTTSRTCCRVAAAAHARRGRRQPDAVQGRRRHRRACSRPRRPARRAMRPPRPARSPVSARPRCSDGRHAVGRRRRVVLHLAGDGDRQRQHPATAPSRLYQLDDRGTAATADDDVVQQLNASELAMPDEPRAAQLPGGQRGRRRASSSRAPSGSPTTPRIGGLYLWERQPPADAAAPR